MEEDFKKRTIELLKELEGKEITQEIAFPVLFEFHKMLKEKEEEFKKFFIETLKTNNFILIKLTSFMLFNDKEKRDEWKRYKEERLKNVK